MAVSVSDIAGLQGKRTFETSNEKVVLQKDIEKIVHSSDYIILGFLNGYMYSKSGPYLIKNTLNGSSIAQIMVEVEHAVFLEEKSYFYAYIDNTIYKITENLEVEWNMSFEDNIRSVTMDVKGRLYVLFKSSRGIRIILNDGYEVMYIDNSDDPTKEVRLYSIKVSKGGGWFYVIGSEFWDYNNKVQSFIDKYDTRTWDRVDRLILESAVNILPDDPQYEYDSFLMEGDYIYIYALQYISKINIKGVEYWRYIGGYNPAVGKFDQVGHIEYSDNPLTEYLYFVEDLYSSNGHSFGKLSLSGNILWKVTLTDSIEKVDFNLSIYNNKLYTTNKTFIQQSHGYVLSVDDNRILFRTRDRHLVEVRQYNDEELFSPENYYGMRLLADTKKDDVEEISYVALLHDNGQVIDEHQNILFLSEENEWYNDPDNYEYKYLLASQYTREPNDISILFGKNCKALLSKMSNVIKTKQPYLPDRVHEFILSLPGNRIDTMQDYNLIRSRFLYSYDRYLLADRNMFYTNITTKKHDYVLVTKKDGFEIIRKTREVYSYIMSKYDDVDLVEEWLKENGVLESTLPDYVNELRHHTVDMIKDVQVAGIPVQYDVKAYKQFKYTFDGTDYYINEWGSQVFSCTNLPYDKRRCQKRIYIDSIANLVRSQEMRPVLFFLNGKAVKWSDCTIIRDWSYSYLLIRNSNPYETDLSCIMFPCDIRYGEDNNCLVEEVCDTHFYFDAEGALTDNRSNVAIRMEVIDKNIVGGHYNYKNGYIEVENNYDQLAVDRNIFVFEENILFPDSRYYISEIGKDIFTYTRDTTNALFKTFYWIKANSYHGTLYKLPNGGYVKDIMIDEAKGGNPVPPVDNFNVPFSFTMSRKKTYAENVAQAVEYIMSYDMSLLVKYYKEQSQIKSYVYTGQYLIDRVPKDGGWLIMPRVRKSNYDDYIMVFRNNHLYEYYKEIQYETHYFKIPIFNHVNRDDTIEIIHFRMVDNSYYKLTIDPGVSDYLPEGLRYDNFLLFGNSPSGKMVYDTFSVENSTQYDINFAYKNIFRNGKYSGTDFKLEDEYYIGKSINVCSKRQFRYMYYNIFYDRNSVNLSPDFRFCHDETKFMIFLNGIILPREKWELHYMTSETPTPYIYITFEDILHEGDCVDIFYLPMTYDVIDITEDIDQNLYNTTGDICISMNKLGYQFDKDLFMLSVNGYKINYSIIENVDNHRCRVTASPIDGGTIDGASWLLYQFLQPEQLLGKLFSYSDHWSDSVDALTPSMYEKLLVERTKI